MSSSYLILRKLKKPMVRGFLKHQGWNVAGWVGGGGVICESHKGDFLKEIKVARSINAIKRTYVIE